MSTRWGEIVKDRAGVKYILKFRTEEVASPVTPQMNLLIESPLAAISHPPHSRQRTRQVHPSLLLESENCPPTRNAHGCRSASSINRVSAMCITREKHLSAGDSRSSVEVAAGSVDVVIPVRDGAKTILATLNSVLSQTTPPRRISSHSSSVTSLG